MLLEDLKTSSHKEEEVFEMKKEYPYVIRNVTSSLGQLFHVSWHWHQELEFVVLKNGVVEYLTLDKKVVLQAGEGVFVNGNILHQIIAPVSESIIEYDVHMFQKDFVAPPKSLIDAKYISPLLQCNEITLIHLKKEDSKQALILNWLEQLTLLDAEGKTGYELESRNIVSKVMLELFKMQEDVIQQAESLSFERESRLKTMLLFIQEHYMENISLKDIAATAHIGERECLRCFQKMLHITPFHYLQSYRVQAACGLLHFTSDSIMEIAMKTGFSSSSYFGKTFRKYMNCTPNEFRKKGGVMEKTV